MTEIPALEDGADTDEDVAAWDEESSEEEKEGAGAGAHSKLPKRWACRVCTLKNKLAAAKCAACGSKRPPSIQRMLSSKRLSASLSGGIKTEHKSNGASAPSSSSKSSSKQGSKVTSSSWSCTKTTWKDIKKAPDRWEISIQSVWKAQGANQAKAARQMVGKTFLLVCDQMASKLDANSYQTNMRGVPSA